MNQQGNTTSSPSGIVLLGTSDRAIAADLQLQELSNFISHIPGGILKCTIDEPFTILEVSSGFLELTGYPLTEIEKNFCTSFCNMIHPDDRPLFLSNMQRQLLQGISSDLEYRLVCKGEIKKWIQVHVRRMSETVCCFALSDVTRLHEAKEALQVDLARHQIILDETSDIIFEWDMAENSLYLSPSWKQKFGYDPVSTMDLNQISQRRHLHPDDLPHVLSLLKKAEMGMSHLTAECRFNDHNNRYIWCRLLGVNQFNALGKPIKLVGIISDIDNEKRMIEQLRAKSERDALTGFYDKETVRSLIQKYLELCSGDEISALMMVDIDNFKKINDTRGHLFGDAVLSEIAAGLKKEFRASDLLGRVGGDEFVILLKSLPYPQIALQKAQRILEMLSHLFESEKPKIQITCSIGIALFPLHGRSFRDLYQRADNALYQAKKMGKNCCTFYSSESDLQDQEKNDFSSGSVIDSARPATGIASNLVEYVFHILYSNEDLEDSIPPVLEVVGRQFDVSRAYVFENSEDGLSCSNTFEWCNTGISQEKDMLQNIPFSSIEDYESVFDDNGIFYCRDVQALPPQQASLLMQQGIRSTLQCILRQNGNFRGFVGFDECTGRRLWTQEEIAALTLLSEILSTFLLKKRTQDKDRKNSRRLREILDLQDAHIYGIDQETYELLYLNKKIKELASPVQEGDFCYKVFFGRDTPCENCPIVCSDLSTKSRVEIYNSKYDVWMAGSASPIELEGRKAFLVSCYDITEYKKLQQKNQQTE